MTPLVAMAGVLFRPDTPGARTTHIDAQMPARWTASRETWTSTATLGHGGSAWVAFGAPQNDPSDILDSRDAVMSRTISSTHTHTHLHPHSCTHRHSYLHPPWHLDAHTDTTTLTLTPPLTRSHIHTHTHTHLSLLHTLTARANLCADGLFFLPFPGLLRWVQWKHRCALGAAMFSYMSTTSASRRMFSRICPSPSTPAHPLSKHGRAAWVARTEIKPELGARRKWGQVAGVSELRRAENLYGGSGNEAGNEVAENADSPRPDIFGAAM